MCFQFRSSLMNDDWYFLCMNDCSNNLKTRWFRRSTSLPNCFTIDRFCLRSRLMRGLIFP